MSIEVMALAWYVGGLTPAQKAVLVALADHAGSDGKHAYPGVERLACKTSLSDRAVRRALSDLRKSKLIKAVKDERYRHRGTEYEFDLPEMQVRQIRPARDADRNLPEKPADLPEIPLRPARDAAKSSINHKEKPATEPGVFSSDDWENVKADLKGMMVKATYDNLIADTELVGVEKGKDAPVVVVRPRNAQEAEWLNRKLATVVTPAIMEYCDRPMAFEARYDEVPS